MRKSLALSVITLAAAIMSLFSFQASYGATPTAAYGFDGNYGDGAAIEREMYYSDEGLVESDGDSFTYTDGKKGQCIHLNGSEALRLNVNMVSESYTISYWIKPDHITECTPSLIITPFSFSDEKFINITLAVDNLSPNIWTHMTEPYDERNSTGIPGLLSTDEWLHITMVVDENMSPELLNDYGIATDEYTSGVAMYANGYLIDVGKVPKNICTDTTTYWFGLNIWDDLYTGYVDELYFYNEALNEDEVREIYIEAGGNPDEERPSGQTKPNNSGGSFRPNGSSFGDDYIEIEQGTLSGSYNHLNMENAAPITTQGVESTTNAYSEIALMAGLGLLLLALGLLLQYIKQKNNSYC